MRGTSVHRHRRQYMCDNSPDAASVLSLQLICRSGTLRFYRRTPGFKMSCYNMINMTFHQDFRNIILSVQLHRAAHHCDQRWTCVLWDSHSESILQQFQLRQLSPRLTRFHGIMKCYVFIHCIENTMRDQQPQQLHSSSHYEQSGRSPKVVALFLLQTLVAI